jgi:hypothetical protein
MNPIETLQKELSVHRRALELSKKKLAEGKITPELHETHKANLEPRINKFTEALRLLTFYMD